jgi:hypothetical protein
VTTTALIIHSALVITVFLAMLNGFLRGSAKSTIDVVLSLVWVGLLATALWLVGWKGALLGLFLSFVYGAITIPIARSVSRRILGYRTSLTTVEGAPDYSVDAMFQRSERTERRLEAIAQRPAIAALLLKNQLTSKELQAQYWFLMGGGLGDLAWEIVSSPADLQRLLNLRREGVPALQIMLELQR